MDAKRLEEIEADLTDVQWPSDWTRLAQELLAALRTEKAEKESELSRVAAISIKDIVDRYLNLLKENNRLHLPDEYSSWEDVWEKTSALKAESERLRGEVTELKKFIRDKQTVIAEMQLYIDDVLNDVLNDRQ